MAPKKDDFASSGPFSNPLDDDELPLNGENSSRAAAYLPEKLTASKDRANVTWPRTGKQLSEALLKSIGTKKDGEIPVDESTQDLTKVTTGTLPPFPKTDVGNVDISPSDSPSAPLQDSSSASRFEPFFQPDNRGETRPQTAIEPPSPSRKRFPVNPLIIAGILLVACVIVAAVVFLPKESGSSGAGVTPATANSTSAATPASSVTPPFILANDVQVLTTATKAKWLDKEITAFNAAYPGVYHATRLPLLESRDGMHAIIDGKVKPTIFSPSSPVWMTRLNTVWVQRHPGQTLADLDDPQGFRLYMRSPLLVITTKDKAAFLSQIFHDPKPWTQVRELSLGLRKTPWGTFKFAHADPLDASSGMYTMSMILDEYAYETHQLNKLDTVANSSGFHDYLAGIEHSFVRNPADFGSSALERDYAADPYSRDFITMYENKALDAVNANPNLRVIYPSRTAVADQSAVVLTAPWVNDHQRQGAIALLEFMSKDPSMQDAVTFNFRPIGSNSSISLNSKLQQHELEGFQISYNSLTLPDYDALNDAASQFKAIIHE